MPTEIHVIGQLATLAPGETHYWEYWFDDFIDAGACYASIATDNRWLGHLEVSQQGMVANIRMVNFVVHLGERSWTYTVSITNRDQSAVSYHLRVARIYA